MAAQAAQLKSAFQPKTRCWVRSSTRAFDEAVVEEHLPGAMVRVRVGEDQPPKLLDTDVANLLSRSSKDAIGIANMDDLPEPHIANVLANVEELFGRQQPARSGAGWSSIYSSVGPVLIAMNPCKMLPLYDEHWVQAFRTQGNAGRIGMAHKSLGPHCYLTAEEAFQNLRSSRRQSVIICGESGAGKTVNNKKMLDYLLDAEAPGREGVAAVVDKLQISKANDLLEYFGNAKTVRNDNSSRFGKYSQLHFDAGNGFRAYGFEIENYLLERSRIVGLPSGERNYHIFHELAQSGSFGLAGGPAAYALTAPGAGVRRVDGETPFDDAKDFREISEKMVAAGFSEPERDAVFQLIASVLHLGNVRFEGGGEGRVAEASRDALGAACGLLGLDAVAFGSALTVKVITIDKADVRSALSAAASASQSAAVCKVVYTRVFDWLVRRINSLLCFGRPSGESATVGLLDIFGFEDMPINGLEQMFINLTNERIQNLFANVMFEKERQIMAEEGIASAFEAGPSNWPCIELFIGVARGASRGPGIVGLLEDRVKTNGADGSAFVSTLMQQFKSHSHFSICNPGQLQKVLKEKRQRFAVATTDHKIKYDECFQIKHYAGELVYTVREFVSKSRDTLFGHVVELLKSSENPFLSEIFSNEEAEQGGGSRRGGKPSIGTVFVGQLDQLAQKLQEGGMLFVRCIKPNLQMMPGIVDRRLTYEQLVNGGVVSCLEIRRYGYPDRIRYDEFQSEFGALSIGWPQDQANSKPEEKCQMLLDRFVGGDSRKYALGKTRIFMKAGVLTEMRATINFRMTYWATRLQTRFRIRKGSELIFKIEKRDAEVKEMKEQIEVEGIAEVRVVNSAMVPVNEHLSNIMAAYGKAKEMHKQNIVKIAADMQSHLKEMSELGTTMKEAEETVKKVLARRMKAMQQQGSKLTSVRQEAQEMLDQLNSFCASCSCCEEHGPEDDHDKDHHVCHAHAPAQGGEEEGPAAVEANLLRAACDARGRMKKLVQHDLPELQQSGLSGVDLNKDDDGSDPLPQATVFLDECRELVRVCEALHEELNGARFAFFQKSSGKQADFEAARAKLEALQEEAAEAIRDGLNGVGDAVSEAWSCEAAVQEEQQRAVSLQSYEAAVEKFILAEQEAEKQLHEALEFLERRRQEEEKCRHEEDLQQRAEMFEAMQELPEAPKLREAGSMIASEVNKAVEELDRLMAAKHSDTQSRLRKNLAVLQEAVKNLGLTEETPPEVIAERRKKEFRDKMWRAQWNARISAQQSEAQKNRRLLIEYASKQRKEHQDELVRLRLGSEEISEQAAQKIADIEAESERIRKEAEEKQNEAQLKHEKELAEFTLREEGLRKEYEATREELQKNPVWIASNSHGLGPAIPPSVPAMVIDHSVVTSVTGAVDALNSGVMKCNEGYCIVYSQRQETYFLIWRPDAEKEAFEAFALEKKLDDGCSIQ